MRKINLLLLALGLAGCSGGENSTSQKLEVLCTTGQVADAVRQVGQGRVEVLATLCGPGADPHSYQATTLDIQLMGQAELVFYNGLHLEERMQDILEQMGPEKAVAASRDLPREALITWQNPNGPEGHDPHVWNDPANWKVCVGTIAQAMSRADTANAQFYQQNASRYLAQIDSVHQLCQQGYASIPPGRRVLVSSHDAFGYLARAYGLENRAILGISTTSEASIRDIQALAEFVAQRQVPTLFVETMVNTKGIEALREAVQSRGWTVAISPEALFSDALGSQPPADTFLGMLEANMRTIVAGLAPQTPAPAPAH